MMMTVVSLCSTHHYRFVIVYGLMIVVLRLRPAVYDLRQCLISRRYLPFHGRFDVTLFYLLLLLMIVDIPV